MNKTELIQKVAEKTGFTQKDTGKTLDAIIDAIQAGVAENEKIQIIGFGSFEARDRKERMGNNPRTGEQVLIPAARVPAFKPGKAFKDAVAIKPEQKAKGKKKK